MKYEKKVSKDPNMYNVAEDPLYTHSKELELDHDEMVSHTTKPIEKARYMMD